jgi:hypothetical protein
VNPGGNGVSMSDVAGKLDTQADGDRQRHQEEVAQCIYALDGTSKIVVARFALD